MEREIRRRARELEAKASKPTQTAKHRAALVAYMEGHPDVWYTARDIANLFPAMSVLTARKIAQTLRDVGVVTEQGHRFRLRRARPGENPRVRTPGCGHPVCIGAAECLAPNVGGGGA